MLDADGAGEEEATEEYYAYDQTPFWTRENASQMLFRFEGPELSDLKSRYLWAPVVDLLLSDEKLTGPSTPGDTYWALGDNLNTVRDIARYDAQTDTTTIVNHRVFDAFAPRTRRCVFQLCGHASEGLSAGGGRPNAAEGSVMSLAAPHR